MIDTVAAAAYVGLAKNTLDKLRVYGDGPRFCKYGRAVRYSIEELDAWIEKNSAASTSEHWRAA
jgi:predicted DNA-binding transcriptional regulator AlpA